VKQEGYSREQAAKQLGVSVETVKTNLERAMKTIRAYCLGKLDGPSLLVIFSLILKK
jgi:DNA-directed RNA polymerase specialized sigma24 family protein